jgi:hypothetical protein
MVFAPPHIKHFACWLQRFVKNKNTQKANSQRACPTLKTKTRTLRNSCQ